jgi:hypothetical protein
MSDETPTNRVPTMLILPEVEVRCSIQLSYRRVRQLRHTTDAPTSPPPPRLSDSLVVLSKLRYPLGRVSFDHAEPDGPTPASRSPARVVFERWITPVDAELDLLRVASLRNPSYSGNADSIHGMSLATGGEIGPGKGLRYVLVPHNPAAEPVDQGDGRPWPAH